MDLIQHVQSGQQMTPGKIDQVQRCCAINVLVVWVYSLKDMCIIDPYFLLNYRNWLTMYRKYLQLAYLPGSLGSGATSGGPLAVVSLSFAILLRAAEYVTVVSSSSGNPRLSHVSVPMRLFSIRHRRYSLARSRHPVAFRPWASFIHLR